MHETERKGSVPPRKSEHSHRGPPPRNHRTVPRGRPSGGPNRFRPKGRFSTVHEVEEGENGTDEEEELEVISEEEQEDGEEQEIFEEEDVVEDE